VGVENVFESLGRSVKARPAIVGAPQPEQQAPIVQEVDWDRSPEKKMRRITMTADARRDIRFSLTLSGL